MAALRWVRTVKASATHKVILWALADMSNDHAECWPSMPALVEATGLSDRGIQKAMPEMERLGLILVDRSKGGRSNRYVLTLAEPRTGFTDQPRTPFTPNVVHPEPHAANPEPGSPPTPNPVHRYPEPGSPGTQKNPQLKPQEPPVARGRAPAVTVALPDWLPADAWADWCQHRRGRKWTQKAADLSIAQLARFRAAGDDPRAVIEQSIASGWQGLFALKHRTGPPVSAKPSPMDGWVEMMRRDAPPGFDFDGTAEEVPR